MDKNLVSITGDDAGNVWVNGELRLTAGSAENRVITLGDLVPPDGSYADTLKVSGVRDLAIHVESIVGGYEDCIDVNHSHDVLISVGAVFPKGKYVATIKGGSTGIRLGIAYQHGHGTETDYDLGNWADQNIGQRTTGIELTVYVVKGLPASARVRVLHAWVPRVNPEMAWDIDVRWKGVFGWVYRILKFLRLA